MQDSSQQPEQQERKVVPVLGTLRMSRNAAILAVLCLVAIAAVAQAAFGGGGGPAVSVSCQKAVTTFTSAKFTCTTNVRTTLAINIGTDKVYTVGTADRSKVTHVVTVPGLAPNTLYLVRATATDAVGHKSNTPWSSFKTLAPGSSPATITAGKHYLLLNKQPVLLTLDQTQYPCPDATFVQGSISMGVNITTDYGGGGSCSGGSPDQWGASLHTILNGQLWWREPDAGPNQQLQSQKLPELIGWLASPATVNSGPPRFGGGDTGFLAGSCSELGTLYANAAKPGTRPRLYWMSVAAHPILPKKPTCMTPGAMAAEYWIIRQYGGNIGYTVADPAGGIDFTPFSGAEATAHQLGLENATLGTVILYGKNVAVTSSAASPVKFKAWSYGGTYYIHATNTSKQTASGSFTLAALKAGGSVQVMYEHRSLKPKGGTVSDRFGSFGNYWYKITPKK